MNLKKFGIEFGIKFIGGVLSSWAIFSFITKFSYRYFSNFGGFTIQNVGWIPFDFPILEAVVFAIGLTLLFINFSEYIK